MSKETEDFIREQLGNNVPTVVNPFAEEGMGIQDREKVEAELRALESARTVTNPFEDDDEEEFKPVLLPRTVAKTVVERPASTFAGVKIPKGKTVEPNTVETVEVSEPEEETVETVEDTGSELGVTEETKEHEYRVVIPENGDEVVLKKGEQVSGIGVNEDGRSFIQIQLRDDFKQLSSKGGKAKRKRWIKLSERDFEILEFLAVFRVATAGILTLVVKNSFSQPVVAEMEKEKAEKLLIGFAKDEGKAVKRPQEGTVWARLVRLERAGFVHRKDVYGAKTVWTATTAAHRELVVRGRIEQDKHAIIIGSEVSDVTLPHNLSIALTAALTIHYGVGTLGIRDYHKSVTLANFITEYEIKTSWNAYCKQQGLRKGEEKQVALANSRLVNKSELGLFGYHFMLPDMTNLDRDAGKPFTIDTAWVMNIVGKNEFRAARNDGDSYRIPDLVLQLPMKDGSTSYVAIEVELAKKSPDRYPPIANKYRDDANRTVFYKKGRIDMKTNKPTKEPGFDVEDSPIFDKVVWVVRDDSLRNKLEKMGKDVVGNRWSTVPLFDTFGKKFNGHPGML